MPPLHLQVLDLTERPGPLLAVRLPAGLAACRRLTQLVLSAQYSAQPASAGLQSLRCLCTPYQPPNEEFWGHLTALTHLQLQCDVGVVFSASLRGMSGLRRLEIMGAVIYDVPAGLYLSRLETLLLQDCQLQAGVPVSLAAATQLRELDVSSCVSGWRTPISPCSARCLH